MPACAIDSYISVSDGVVRYLGYPVILTDTELMILSALLQNRQGYIDSETLMKRCIVGEDRGVGNIPVHICSINKKLAEIGGRNIIVSKRGLGYKITDTP